MQNNHEQHHETQVQPIVEQGGVLTGFADVGGVVAAETARTGATVAQLAVREVLTAAVPPRTEIRCGGAHFNSNTLRLGCAIGKCFLLSG